MTIEGAILARFKEVTAITDIVGAAGNARIYALQLPQHPTLEAITFHMVSAPRVHAFSADPGLVMSRWQIDAWATTYELARTLADAIRGDGAASAFSRWSGTKDSTVVQAVFLDAERPAFEDQTGHYRNIQDYIVWYEE